MTTTAKWAKTCRQQPSGFFVHACSLCFFTALVNSSYQSAVSGTAACYSETRATALSLKHQKRDTRNDWNTERSFDKKTGTKHQNNNRVWWGQCTWSFMSKHIYIHSTNIEMLLFYKPTFFFFFLALAHYYQKWHRPRQFVIYLECLSVLANSEQRQRGRANEETGAVLWLGEQRSQVLAANGCIPILRNPSK